MGLTITDDIKPWIGQYIGLGIFDIRMNNSEVPFSWSSQPNRATTMQPTISSAISGTVSKRTMMKYWNESNTKVLPSTPSRVTWD